MHEIIRLIKEAEAESGKMPAVVYVSKDVYEKIMDVCEKIMEGRPSKDLEIYGVPIIQATYLTPGTAFTAPEKIKDFLLRWPF